MAENERTPPAKHSSSSVPGLEQWDGKNIWEGIELLGKQEEIKSLSDLLRLTAVLEEYRRVHEIPDEAQETGEQSGKSDSD